MKLNIYENATTYESAKDMLSKIDNSDFLVDHVVVVPDKFSLLTEKMVLDYVRGSLFNVRVKTLSSLSVELLEKLGLGGSEVISSGENLLLTSQAIENVKDQFLTFKKSNISFCYEISKLISQFKSSSISPEGLNEKAAGLTGNKYHDLSLIYKEYQRLLEGKLDANERLKILKDKLENENILSNTKFYFAHFDAFTKEGFDFLKVLLKKSAEINISLPKAISIGNEYIYEKDIQQKLIKILTECGGMLNVFSPASSLSKEREAIVKGVYSYQKENCQNKGFYNLYGGASLSQEVESLAKLIRFHVFKGCRYRDFQVAAGDLGKYAGQIENIFDRFNIPYYIDLSITADKTILGNFILQLFQIVNTGFSKESLIDFSCNVLMEKDLNFVENCQKYDADGLAKYKKYIEKDFSFAAEVDALCRAKTAQDFGNIVLKACQKVEEKHQEILDELEAGGQVKERNLNVQAKEILEEAVLLINKYSAKEISCGEYFKKLNLLLSFKTVSTVPTYVDAVMIGDATESGFEERPMLCILGGENLPVAVGDNGLLSDDEMKLNFADQVIEPSIRMINRRNRFKLFNLLSLAEKGLFIFYQLINEEGKKNELPSYIKNLNEIFAQMPLSCGSVFYGNKANDEDLSLLSCDIEEKEVDFDYLSRQKALENAEELMLNGGKLRVTQLENYFVCPFKHFANYGLKLKEKNADFDARDLGNVCHKMAELFVRDIIKGKDYKSINLKEFIDKNTPRVFESENVKEKIEILEEGASLVGFLKKQMLSLLRDIVKELDKSLFRPAYTEMKFDNLYLCDGKYKLIGKADRIDVWGDYVRVVDYKTGRTGSLIKQLYYGEKLQLFLYQKIIAEKFGKKEGGVFYFNAKFNYTKADENEIVLKGIIDKNEDLINAVDSDIEFIGKSGITQIYKDSKGYKGASLSSVQLSKLCQYALAAAERATKEIEEGFIQPKPCSEGCQWCPYGALCGHEESDGERKNDEECEF